VKVLPRLLPALRADYPDVEFSLRSLSSRDELIAALANREVDIAFLRAPVVHPELATTFLFNEDFMAVLPSAHPLAMKSKLSLQDLRALPFLFCPPATISPSVEKALRSAGIDPFNHRMNWDTRNIYGGPERDRLGNGVLACPGLRATDCYVRIEACAVQNT
jgi:LysR family hca operon transcriptional activator